VLIAQIAARAFQPAAFSFYPSSFVESLKRDLDPARR
jgi:hypothetical protein